MKEKSQLQTPHLGSVSTCAQCDNYIQFDGERWFHVNGTIKHAAFPARDENKQRADELLEQQAGN